MLARQQCTPWTSCSAAADILLVDASNAFNALSRSAALHNISRTCPAMAKIFVNTYFSPCRLFVTGEGEIHSEEETCLGDPLAMAIYAVAIMPMIRHLSRACPTTTQCWYADDDGASDNLSVLQRYWDELNKVGPGFGYFPNAVKTILLTKSAHEDKAFELFSNTGVKIRTDGCRYLGGVLGEDAFCRSYMEALVKKWRAEFNKLARLQRRSRMLHILSLLRVCHLAGCNHIRSMNCPPETFAVLDNLINTELLQALTGHAFQEDQSMRHLLAFPARMGGLAIPVLSKVAQEEHNASRRITAPFVNIIAPGIRAMECGPILEAVAETRDQKR